MKFAFAYHPVVGSKQFAVPLFATMTFEHVTVEQVPDYRTWRSQKAAVHGCSLLLHVCYELRDPECDLFLNLWVPLRRGVALNTSRS